MEEYLMHIYNYTYIDVESISNFIKQLNKKGSEGYKMLDGTYKAYTEYGEDRFFCILVCEMRQN